MAESSPSTPPGRALVEVLIDDATWEAASAERRREWRAVLDELIAEHRFELPPGAPLRMLVTVGAGRITLDARSTEGQMVAMVEVPIEGGVDAHLREYVEICREMGMLGEGDNSPKLEALDIAKRLVHDEAADTVRVLCRAFGPDLATSRRLFTLLVTLSVDTTRLVRPHHLDGLGARRRR